MRFWSLSVLSAIFIICGLGLCVEGVAMLNWQEAFWAAVAAIAGMVTFAYEFNHRKKPTA